MAVWWVPGTDTTRRRAVICIPGTGTEEHMRQALEHCTQRHYHVIAVAGGRAGWHDARRMLKRKDADVVVTVPGGPPSGPDVEIAWPEEAAA